MTHEEQGKNPGDVLPPYTQGLVVQTGVAVETDNPYATAIARTIATSQRQTNAMPVITFSEYEAACLSAYYGQEAVIGTEKDFPTFTTLTEILPAAIARNAMTVWENMGKPADFQVIEMGAGDGSQALRFLQWAERYDPAFANAIRYSIVEFGRHLIDEQKAKLANYQDRVTWYHGSALQLPDEISQVDGVFLSNELIDTFAAEVVTRSADGEVLQKMVGIQDGQWVEVWERADPAIVDYINRYEFPLYVGWQTPLQPDAQRFMHHVASRLRRGAVISIDYGNPDYELGRRQQSPVSTFGTLHRAGGTEGASFSEYRHVGLQDVTVRISGQPLVRSAAEAALHTELIGSQMAFIQTADVGALVAQMQLILDGSNSLAEKAHWTRQLKFAQVLADGERKAGRFIAHMATRDVPPGILDITKDYSTLMLRLASPSLEVPVSTTDGAVTLDATGITHRGKPGPIVPLRVANGVVRIPYDFVKGSRLVAADGTVLRDFRDPNKLAESLVDLGLTP